MCCVLLTLCLNWIASNYLQATGETIGTLTSHNLSPLKSFCLRILLELHKLETFSCLLRLKKDEKERLKEAAGENLDKEEKRRKKK